MKFSIVIPHLRKDKNSDYLLGRCLHSIAMHEKGMLSGVTIIDDASDSINETKVLAAKYGAKLLRKTERTSYSAVINLGIDDARMKGADVLITMNNDIELTQRLQPAIAAAFEKHHRISVVGIGLYYPDGRIQHESFEVGMDLDGQNEITNMYGYGEYTARRDEGYATGVTGALQAIHLGRTQQSYDPEFPLSYEDVDFCINEWLNGNRVYYTNKTSAIHSESATRGYPLGDREKASLMRFLTKPYALDKVGLALQQARASHE